MAHPAPDTTAIRIVSKLIETSNRFRTRRGRLCHLHRTCTPPFKRAHRPGHSRRLSACSGIRLLVCAAFFSPVSPSLVLLRPLADSSNCRTPLRPPTCAASPPSATASPGPAAPTAPSCAQKTEASSGRAAPPQPTPPDSTSAASRPSTPRQPSSCPAAKAPSAASTKPPTAAAPGNSSSQTPTPTAFGTRLASLR